MLKEEQYASKLTSVQEENNEEKQISWMKKECMFERKCRAFEARTTLGCWLLATSS